MPLFPLLHVLFPDVTSLAIAPPSHPATFPLLIIFQLSSQPHPTLALLHLVPSFRFGPLLGHPASRQVVVSLSVLWAFSLSASVFVLIGLSPPILSHLHRAPSPFPPGPFVPPNSPSHSPGRYHQPPPPIRPHSIPCPRLMICLFQHLLFR